MREEFSPRRVGALFADALGEVVATVSGASIDMLSDEPDAGFCGVVGCMSLAGSIGGTILLSAEEDDLRVLCSYIAGVPADEVTREEMDDTLCELVNMTAGSVKLRLGVGENFTLTPPFVLRGAGICLGTKKRTRFVSLRMGNEEVSLRLKVVSGR